MPTVVDTEGYAYYEEDKPKKKRKKPMKTYEARVVVKTVKTMFVQAKTAAEAQRRLGDLKVPKLARTVDVELTYGNVKESNENPFKTFNRKDNGNAKVGKVKTSAKKSAKRKTQK
jgi:hypothetical protein